MDNQLPKTPRSVKLRSATDVRKEQARNYNRYIRGEIDDKSAKTRTFMLNVHID